MFYGFNYREKLR